MHESEKAGKKEMERPPHSGLYRVLFLLFPILFQLFRSKGAAGLSRQRLCLQSENRQIFCRFLDGRIGSLSEGAVSVS